MGNYIWNGCSSRPLLYLHIHLPLSMMQDIERYLTHYCDCSTLLKRILMLYVANSISPKKVFCIFTLSTIESHLRPANSHNSSILRKENTCATLCSPWTALESLSFLPANRCSKLPMKPLEKPEEHLDGRGLYATHQQNYAANTKTIKICARLRYYSPTGTLNQGPQVRVT